MSTANLSSGRSAQKQRTHTALVAAARELLSEGVTPTIEAAAERAHVSRPTAYRYFKNRGELLIAAHPEVTTSSLLPTPAPSDVHERLDAVAGAFVRLIAETEPQQRAMLRASLDGATNERLPLRQGRAIGWIEEALEPLRSRLDDTRVHALAVAIRSAIGIESRVWLADIAGVDARHIEELMVWTARALLRGALVEPPPGVRA